MSKKDIKKIVRLAQEQGWTVSQGKRSQHWKFISPDPRVPPIFTSGTPSDFRTVANLTARLRKGHLAI